MNDNQDEKPALNGHGPRPAEPQVVEAGAIVPIDAEVMTNGVLFVHPQLPPFKLWFKVVDGQLQHSFEIIQPVAAAPEPEKESGFVMPGKKKLILPPGHA